MPTTAYADHRRAPPPAEPPEVAAPIHGGEPPPGTPHGGNRGGRQAARRAQEQTESGTRCSSTLDPYGDHALVFSKGRGGQMGAWQRARHDGARNILVRLGKAAGLREGVDMDVEVPYLFTRYRPSDRIRPGGQDMHFSRAPPPRRTRP